MWVGNFVSEQPFPLTLHAGVSTRDAALRRNDMAQITIEVSEELARELTPIRDRLPEVLARALHEPSSVLNETYRYVLKFLTSNPSPQEILDFKPTPLTQERISELLEKNRSNRLTPGESAELDEYERIEHWVRMLKIRALKG